MKTFRNSGQPHFDSPSDESYAAKYDPTFPDEVRGYLESFILLMNATALLSPQFITILSSVVRSTQCLAVFHQEPTQCCERILTPLSFFI